MFDKCRHEYIFSGSLPENASTYVKREADDQLYEALQQGKFCYVLNSRQSGKSSLRLRTMSRLYEKGVECAAIDLSSINIQGATQENWYADLITILINSFVLDINLKDWWEQNQLNSPLMRFTNFIEKHLLVEIEEPVVIFIDEIDSVLSLKFPTDDFFAFIRACYNQRVDNPKYNRLTFCLLGVASPSNLIQDKKRTPFNIGKAISLKGFRLDEAEPLERGLRGKFSDSQAVIQQILDWTGGQPFLTQKLCQFMLEESEEEKPRTVEQVVKSRIIQSWESQDEPEHLRTIRARILRNEERAGYLLELYQQIRLSKVESSITADNTIEQSELLLSGLVARREGKLRVYNGIYQEVFNQSWVENELNNLRPYSENFRFWITSGAKDESRLLRGKALADAEEWAKDKNLSFQDKQFLAASREKEIQEKIAADEQEAKLEREKKDKEATEQRNQVLSKANNKAKRRIQNGTVILILALLSTIGLAVFAAIEGNKAFVAQKNADNANQKAIKANQNFETAKTKAEGERKKVLILEQKTKEVEKKFKDIEQKAQQATKKAETERRKAEQAQRSADDANQKAIEAREQAQKAQQDADSASQKAIEAGTQTKAEQTKAEQAERKANVANQRALEAAKKAEIEKRKAEQAEKEARNLQNQIVSEKKNIETVQELSKLAGELRNENLITESDDALRQAGLSFRVHDYNLKQAMLLASMSQAYQNLKNPEKAKETIDESLNYLNNKENQIISNERLQISVLVKANQGNLLTVEYPKRAVIAYTQAYDILRNYPSKTNPFGKDTILTAKDITLIHRVLLDSLPDDNLNLKQQVRDSFKKHFYAELENFLKVRDWQAADEKTEQLMLFIANIKWLDIPSIKNFSCQEYKKIDELWVQNSDANFGFSVQKKIWIDTGNRLDIKTDWNLNHPQYDNYMRNFFRFATTIGWNSGTKGYDGSGWLRYEDLIKRIKQEPLKSNRGSLPAAYGSMSLAFLGRFDILFSRCDL